LHNQLKYLHYSGAPESTRQPMHNSHGAAIVLQRNKKARLEAGLSFT
jgi:hypothetical protein